MVTLGPASIRAAATAGRPRSAAAGAVAKHDPRVEAYGTTDEANSVIGLAHNAIAQLPRTIAASGQKPMPCWAASRTLFDPAPISARPIGAGQARRGRSARRRHSQVERLDGAGSFP